MCIWTCGGQPRRLCIIYHRDSLVCRVRRKVGFNFRAADLCKIDRYSQCATSGPLVASFYMALFCQVQFDLL